VTLRIFLCALLLAAIGACDATGIAESDDLDRDPVTDDTPLAPPDRKPSRADVDVHTPRVQLVTNQAGLLPASPLRAAIMPDLAFALELARLDRP